MFGEKIGLSYVIKAVELGIINELQGFKYADLFSEKIRNEHYYYYLGLGGINLLRMEKLQFRKLKAKDSFHSRLNILQFNYMAMDKDLYWIKSSYSDTKNYSYFHCKNPRNQKDIILFFNDQIRKYKILHLLEAKFTSKINKDEQPNFNNLLESFISKFEFKTIERIETSYSDTLLRDYRIGLSENEINHKIRQARLRHIELYEQRFGRDKGWDHNWDPGELMTEEELFFYKL